MIRLGSLRAASGGRISSLIMGRLLRAVLSATCGVAWAAASPGLGDSSDDTKTLPVTIQLTAGPVAGITERDWVLSDGGSIALPRPGTATFTARKFGGDGTEQVSYRWHGAQEQSDGGLSTALFQQNPGTYTVKVVPIINGTRGTPISISVQVHDVAAGQIAVHLDDPAPGYATYVGNPFACRAHTEPAGFEKFLKWDASGHTPALAYGGAFTASRSQIGDGFPIRVGLPATAPPAEVSVMIYEAQWVRQPRLSDYAVVTLPPQTGPGNW